MIASGSEYKILPDKWHSEIFAVRSIKYADITIETVKNAESILKLSKLWDDLLSRSSNATIFQTFEWLYNWWNYFASENKNSLHILLISTYGKLIGIAPFFIRSLSIGNIKSYHLLKIMGSGTNSLNSKSNAIEEHGISDYLDVIVEDGFEEKVAAAVSSYLEDYRYFFNEIDFQNVQKDSFIFNWLIPELEKRNFIIRIADTDLCPKLILPATMNEYLSSLKPGARRKLKQVQKITEEENRAEIKSVSFQNYSDSIQTLKQLHQKRWNELGYLGLFSDKRFEKFISNVSQAFFNKGLLWFKVVKHNNKIIAARLAYKFKNTIYDYLSGFDSRQFAASLRPGITLIYSMINDSMSGGLKIVDFLRGAEEYKFELATDVSANHRISIYHPDSPLIKKINIVGPIKSTLKILFRIKCEMAIVKLHMEKFGTLIFLFPYSRFCFKRIKSFAIKNYIWYFNTKKWSNYDVENKFSSGDVKDGYEQKLPGFNKTEFSNNRNTTNKKLKMRILKKVKT